MVLLTLLIILTLTSCKKYEDVFALYLEAIDKYVMDSIYKRVKNRTATTFEENALSEYYNVTHLKETQYVEYKYRKQKYLLELDYETIRNTNKEKILMNVVWKKEKTVRRQRRKGTGGHQLKADDRQPENRRHRECGSVRRRKAEHLCFPAYPGRRFADYAGPHRCPGCYEGNLPPSQDRSFPVLT